MLFALVLVSGVILALLVVDHRAVNRAFETGLPPDVAGFESAHDRFRLAIAVGAGAGAMGIFGLAAWTLRVYRNTSALGARHLRFAHGWAVGGWFVPLLGWIRSTQILGDAWRAADFQAESEDWRSRPAPRWLAAWGSLLVVAGAGAVAAAFLEPTSAPTYWLLGTAAAWGLVLVSAVVTTFVVRRITDHQEAAAWFKFGVSPRFGSERRDQTTALGVVLAAALAGVGVFAVGSSSPATSDVTGGAAGDNLHYSGFGVSFDYPKDLNAVETPVFGSEVTRDVGAVFTYSHDQSDYAAVTWVIAAPEYTTDQLWGLLDGGVQGMEAEGATVGRGQEAVVTVRGQRYVVLEFTGSGQGETFEGVMAAGNCPGSDRAVAVFALSDGPFVETRATFEGLLDSVRC